MAVCSTPFLAVASAAVIKSYLLHSATAFAPQALPRANVQLAAETLASETSPSSTDTITDAATNVNFGDWIADAPNEITEWTSCPVEGTIPSYVQGTLIRNGGGIWSVPNTGEMYSHIFDGLAKIHSYRIQDSRVDHQARFLNSNWYEKYEKSDKQQLPAGIGTGPVLNADGEPKKGIWQIVQATVDSATIFDNTPVNIWDWTPNVRDPAQKRVTALTDAPPRTTIDFDTMETLSSSTMNPLADGAKGYEMFITAHPMYGMTEQQSISSSTSSVDTYNAAVELGLNGPRVNLIKETSEGERSVISSFDCDDGKVPYMHSFGLSKNYATIVLQPVRLDIGAMDKMIELGFLRSMEQVDYTRVVLIELSTGKIVLDKTINDKVYFYHSISQAETLDENGNAEVSLRLCAYNEPSQLTGEHQFMRLEKCRKSKELRNKLHPGGKFCDVVCNANNQNVEVQWNKDIDQGFELPITRYSRTYDGELPPSDDSQDQQSHPRYVYGFGAYALGSPDYDNWGLWKFDLQENKIAAYYQSDSVYLSEPQFVADPNGANEDDGVLLSQVYFGREQETKLLVIDAATMKVMAEVPTGNRAPMDFHGAWIPTPGQASPL